MWLLIILLIVVSIGLILARYPETPSRPEEEAGDAAKPEPAARPTVRMERTIRAGRPDADRPPHGDDFLPTDRQLDRVIVDGNGYTNLRFIRFRGRMVIETPNGLLPVSKGSRLRTLGIYTFRPRGVSYHERAGRMADTTSLRTAVLVREPDNPHDPNAVAVRPLEGETIGYVNKQTAAWLSKRMDAGERYSAVFLNGSPAGEDGTPDVLAAPSGVLDTMLRAGIKDR